MKRGKWIVKMIVFGIVAIGLFGLVTMFLWNALVPDLFHGPELNYWQALGLIVLSKIFFSGFAKRGHQGPGHWRGYWKEKWQGMTPEEKERFKLKMKDKWCCKVDDTPEGNSGTSNV